MKRGPKPELPSVKAARGTFKPSRDGDKVEIVVAGDPPVMPDWMQRRAGGDDQDAFRARAVAIWEEVAGRVIQTGVTELDSNLLARYCAVQAAAEQLMERGEMPPSAALAELRRMEELLGIAGPKSRVARLQDAGRNHNPFLAHKR